jgi:N12 class adenine-specific DNA methylase
MFISILLFEREEAAKQWSRREQEWNHDKESREKLMHQLLNERQKQINEKLQTLKEQQKENYERQRILIDDIEQARKYDLIEKQKQVNNSFFYKSIWN